MNLLQIFLEEVDKVLRDSKLSGYGRIIFFILAPFIFIIGTIIGILKAIFYRRKMNKKQVKEKPYDPLAGCKGCVFENSESCIYAMACGSDNWLFIPKE